MEDLAADLGHLWGVHSSKDDPTTGPRPELRGWAKTEGEAREVLERIRAEDAGAREADRYWVARMTQQDERDYRTMGLLFEDSSGN